MSEQTIKCPICQRPYVFYDLYSGDQSACPECRQQARGNTGINGSGTTAATCTHPGCKETGHWSFDTQREARDHYRKRQKWKCSRHAYPDEVLAPNAHYKVTRVTCTESNGHKYWHDGKRLGSGFTYGPGFRAWAYDFPEGTVLTITAHIELP